MGVWLNGRLRPYCCHLCSSPPPSALLSIASFTALRTTGRGVSWWLERRPQTVGPVLAHKSSHRFHGWKNVAGREQNISSLLNCSGDAGLDSLGFGKNEAPKSLNFSRVTAVFLSCFGAAVVALRGRAPSKTRTLAGAQSCRREQRCPKCPETCPACR